MGAGREGQGRRGVLTERDRRWLLWVAGFRFVSVAQLARRFEVSEAIVYRRLSVWRHLGVAGHRRPLRELAGAVWVTPRGGRLLGVGELRAPALSMVSFRHELAVCELAVDYERPGRAVLTERAMRRSQRDGDTDWSVPVNYRGAGRRWPDLAVQEPGGWVAVEVEFAPKRSERLRAILDAYQASAYGAVVFVVEHPALAQRLARLACEADENGRVVALRTPKLRIQAWRASAQAAAVARVGTLHAGRVEAHQHVSGTARARALLAGDPGGGQVALPDDDLMTSAVRAAATQTRQE